MKKKENRVMSFRFEDHILNKIDWLVDKENEKLKGLGIKPKTRKQIIEEIIEKHYFDIINESRDPDVVGRISNMVKDQTDIHYDALRKRLASMENYFTGMDTSGYNQDDLRKMKAEAIPLINIIMQRLDIDIGEL